MTAIERKSQTERLLKSLNIPFIDHLPLIEEETDVRILKPQEIAKRILVLTYLNYVSEEPEDRVNVIDFLKEHKLWDSVSHDEKELYTKDLTDQETFSVTVTTQHKKDNGQFFTPTELLILWQGL